eukprot:5355237-Pyramimonas_sp.AAC.2
MGVLLLREDRYDEALPALERSLEVREKVYGPRHPHVATGLNNLATAYEKIGKYTVAKSLFARALEIREDVMGKDHAKTRGSRCNLVLLGEDPDVVRGDREASEQHDHAKLSSSLSGNFLTGRFNKENEVGSNGTQQCRRASQDAAKGRLLQSRLVQY